MITRKTYLMIGASALTLLTVPSLAFAQDAPASVAEDAEEPEIVVSGYRLSLETAQAIKKDSDQIVDSIVAEDVGKLPDQTGAESLARVTGVSVERGTGEAAAVRVRGLPDLTTTYNGRELFTAEGRSVALQDFPAGTISRFDVYKTSSANLIEAGIAGEIDVRSRKPFDFKGSRIAGGITGLHWQNSQKTGIDANLLLSKRFDTGIGEIGILVEGSYTDNKFSDDHRTNSSTIQTRANNVPNPGLQYPAVLTYQPDVSNRFRPSGGATIQWRPSNELEVYTDFLFQGFRGRGRGVGLQVNVGSAATLSNVVLCGTSTTQVCSMTVTGGNATSAYLATNVSQTDTYQAGAGFIWRPGRAKIVGDFAFTDSVFQSALYQAGLTTLTTGTRTFNFNTGNGGVAQVLDIDLTNPANWRYSGFSQNNSRNHGRSYQARIDVEVPADFGPIDKVYFGSRFNDRSADSEAVPSSFASGTIAAQNAALVTVAPLEYGLVDPSYTNDPLAHPRTWILPTRDAVIHNFDYLRSLATVPALRTVGLPPRSRTYLTNEKSYALYAQAHYTFDLGETAIDGLIGLRAVRTDNSIDGLQTLTTGTPPVTTVTPITRIKRYYDYLPNISARIKFTPQLQARLSFTKTRTRPTFGQLNPTVTIGSLPTAGCVVVPPATTPDPTTCFRNASGGNPLLEPIKSTNYDASLEYYFSRSGSVTVQVFQRDVIGFINNRTTTYDDPVLGRINVNQPENGEQGRIRGVEAGFRTFLTIPSLPKWMQNFGVLANYTYLDHFSVLSQAVQVTLPGRQPIGGVSKHLANAQIFYENKFISLRASYNYRSSFRFYSQVDAAVGTLPTFEKGRGTLDLSAGINPVENISLTFNATNIIANPARNARQFTRAGAIYPWQVRYLESIYRVGVRFRF